MGDWLIIQGNHFGGIASILGLLISMYVLIKVRSISKRFNRKARLPDYKKRIKKSSSEIWPLLNNCSTNKQKLENKFAELRGFLVGLEDNLDRKERQNVRGLLNIIRRKRGFNNLWKKPRFTEEYANKVYENIQEVYAVLITIEENDRWA